MARIQDYLGSIHDSDVLIRFLEGSRRAADLSRVISAEKRRRRREFRNFARLAGAGLEQTRTSPSRPTRV